jgi:hypothetical protein
MKDFLGWRILFRGGSLDGMEIVQIDRPPETWLQPIPIKQRSIKNPQPTQNQPWMLVEKYVLHRTGLGHVTYFHEGEEFK